VLNSLDACSRQLRCGVRLDSRFPSLRRRNGPCVLHEAKSSIARVVPWLGYEFHIGGDITTSCVSNRTAEREDYRRHRCDERGIGGLSDPLGCRRCRPANADSATRCNRISSQGGMRVVDEVVVERGQCVRRAGPTYLQQSVRALPIRPHGVAHPDVIDREAGHFRLPLEEVSDAELGPAG
jgi:hypothetical protein